MKTPTLRPLRPHQQDALERLRQSVDSGHRRPILQAPTGFGKTLTAAHFIAGALSRGERVAFVVPRLSLIDQTVEAFQAEGLANIGVVQGNHPRRNPKAPIQICSAQTLTRRECPAVDFVLVDEAHIASKSVFQWMAVAPATTFIGLSATPWSRGLGKHYDDLIVGATTLDLIDTGYLSAFRVFAPRVPDLSKVRKRGGDFREEDLGTVMDAPRLVADVVDTWLLRARDLPTLVFAVNRAHAAHLCRCFSEAGITAEYIDCYTGREERQEIFQRFRTGTTRVICNVDTLTVGVDLDVRCIVDARPTASEIRYVQMIGRGLRAAEGKDRLIILDHAGNVQRLGLVTDIHRQRLDDGAARQTAANRKQGRYTTIRLCEECKCVLAPRKLKCDACGHEASARSDVKHCAGELVEYGSGRAPRTPREIEEAGFYSELKGYAATKGYAAGWASHQFRERFGRWPNEDHLRGAKAREPGSNTNNWIRSRQIAYARRREHA